MTTTVTNPTEVIQSMYAAFGHGDLDSVLAKVAPDCRWKASGEGIPATGEYSGIAGVQEFFGKLMASEEVLRFEPREFIASGDRVVALGFEECRMRKTEKKASTSWAMVFRVREGKVVEFETFFDTAAYAKAHAG